MVSSIARELLSRRSVSATGGYDSGGGGEATPLALPELLKFLVSRLEQNGFTLEEMSQPRYSVLRRIRDSKVHRDP